MGLSLAEFDALPDLERSLRVAAWHRAQDACPHCGNPRDLCSDPERKWFPQRVICHATAEQQAAARLYDQLHEKQPYHNGDFTSWAEKPSPFHPYRYDDGVTIIVTPTDLGIGGDFLAPPEGPETPAQEAP